MPCTPCGPIEPLEMEHVAVVVPEKVTVAALTDVATTEVIPVEAPLPPSMFPEPSKQVTHGVAVFRL